MEVAKMALSICTIVKSIPTLATKVGGVISKLGNISSWGASGASGAGGEAVLAGNLVKVEAFVKATSTTIAGVISTGTALLSVTSPLDSTVSHFTEETSGGGYNEYKKKANIGQQNKHIPGTNEYNVALNNGQNKSTMYGTIDDIQNLLNEYSGKGTPINSNKERVDFGKIIGKYYDTENNKFIETTIGIIHYGKNGAHIVPARP